METELENKVLRILIKAILSEAGDTAQRRNGGFHAFWGRADKDELVMVEAKKIVSRIAYDPSYEHE